LESRNKVQPGWKHGRAKGSVHARCCHHAPSRPVDPFIFNLVALEDRLERERGKPCLFALVRRQGFMMGWDVFLAAPWVQSDLDGARRSLVAELASWLEPGERAELGGVHVLRPCDPFVGEVLERAGRHELLHELRAGTIEDVVFERAIIINSCSAD